MDMPADGVEVGPIKNKGGAEGGAVFGEVFFTDVRVPAENLIGEENLGWGMAKLTLANERVSLSKGGLIWGNGPTVGDLVDLVKKDGGVDHPVLRQQLVDAYVEGEILRYHHLRQISAAVNK